MSSVSPPTASKECFAPGMVMIRSWGLTCHPVRVRRGVSRVIGVFIISLPVSCPVNTSLLSIFVLSSFPADNISDMPLLGEMEWECLGISLPAGAVPSADTAASPPPPESMVTSERTREERKWKLCSTGTIASKSPCTIIVGGHDFASALLSASIRSGLAEYLNSWILQLYQIHVAINHEDICQAKTKLSHFHWNQIKFLTIVKCHRQE